MVRRWLIQHRLGLVVGTGLTIAAGILHVAGWTQPIEWQFYDALVRHFSRVPASGRILHVDIDDNAIERFASWPWPRDTQADLIRILHELGAERVVADLVWADPKPPEIRLPSLDPYADLEGEIEQIGELSAENTVSPDDELAQAVSESGPVYLALYGEDRTASALSNGDAHLARRVEDLLRQDFSLAAESLSSRLGVPVDGIAAVLPGVKRAVARELVAARMTSSPPPTARQIHEALLPTPFDRPTADRADLLAAYYRELGIRNLLAKAVAVPAGLKGQLPVLPDLAPPIYKLTAGNARTGFVNFKTDRDGVLRRIPLMMEWRGRLVEQLAFAAARDTLDIRPEDMSIEPGPYLRIAPRGDRPAMRIQLDDHGCMMLNWHVADARWEQAFRHLPVGKLLEIHEARERLRQNQTLRQVRLGEAVRIVQDDAGYAGYRGQVGRMLKLRRVVRSAELQGRSDTEETRKAREEAGQLAGIIEQTHQATIALIRETWKELSKEPNPADPAIASEYKRFSEAHRIIEEAIPRIDVANAVIAAQATKLVDQLRPTVAGKVCFIGYTATAIADMVNTPAYERMPGVLIHSQVFNAFAENRFRRWAGTLTQFLVVIGFGLCSTLVATMRGPRSSLLFVLAAIGLTLLVNALGPFAHWDFWLQLLTALLLTFVIWALVVMIRYLVTDRERRRFSKAVAQYVSPAMARQIGESAQNLSFAPVNAVVSCFFSDLAGFTSLSEKLGPQGTRAVLNPYLETMSEVLHHHRALINKFMGDGIFAFFNPPILPCPDHELAVCEAALDSQAALADLIRKHAQTPWAGDFQRLAMRIGIASGPVFVGDFGSEAKLDYTCMGDVVNLASRLESANKQFGTSIMVAGSTREKGGDRYAYRHLGILQVKGKTTGIAVYELLGRRNQVADEIQFHARTFDAAVSAFCQRDWISSRQGFEQCLALRPQDPAVRRYLNAIDDYERESPPADWSGTLQLTEK
jgi:class 3 adenylate cyclase/CHASE2 domain-containing sensor protein